MPVCFLSFRFCIQIHPPLILPFFSKTTCFMIHSLLCFGSDAEQASHRPRGLRGESLSGSTHGPAPQNSSLENLKPRTGFLSAMSKTWQQCPIENETFGRSVQNFNLRNSFCLKIDQNCIHYEESKGYTMIKV